MHGDSHEKISLFVQDHLVIHWLTAMETQKQMQWQQIHSIPANTSSKSAEVSASALNDLGVSLLEQNCFQQALDTFQDAFDVFEGVETVASSPVLHYQVSERLCRPHVFPHRSLVKCTSVSLRQLATARSLDTVFGDIVLSPGSQEYYRNGRVAIRIQDDEEARRKEAHQDLTRAVILYNWGVAQEIYFYAAVVSPVPPSSYPDRRRALRLLELSAGELMPQHYNTCPLFRNKNNPQSFHVVSGDDVIGVHASYDESIQRFLFQIMVLIALHGQVVAVPLPDTVQRETRIRREIGQMQSQLVALFRLAELAKDGCVVAAAA